MPTLKADGKLVDDQWHPVDQRPAGDAANAHWALLPEDLWNNDPGLMLAVDAEPQPEHLQAECIGIHFAAFNDGRGLSLAVLLRQRLGYTGMLRAYGDVHPDMLHYLSRCGFDSFELPHNRSVDTALQALQPYSAYYQASAVDPEPKFRRS